MPIIEMFVPTGRVSAQQKRTLHKRLGRQVAEVEGARGEGPHESTITWMFITERSDEEWSVGGEPVTADGATRVFTRVFVQHGALDDPKRKELARRVSQEITDALGGNPGVLNNYCLIQEIPTGNWSAGGMVVSFADVMRFLGLEEDVFSYDKETVAQLRQTVEPKAEDPAREEPVTV